MVQGHRRLGTKGRPSSQAPGTGAKSWTQPRGAAHHEEVSLGRKSGGKVQGDAEVAVVSSLEVGEKSVWWAEMEQTPVTFRPGSSGQRVHIHGGAAGASTGPHFFHPLWCITAGAMMMRPRPAGPASSPAVFSAASTGRGPRAPLIINLQCQVGFECLPNLSWHWQAGRHWTGSSAPARCRFWPWPE
jgi:hypothetical protein